LAAESTNPLTDKDLWGHNEHSSYDRTT